MNMEKKQRVLIVDDSADNIQVLMGLLKDEYKLVAATSGEKALALAAQQPPPDLILLDIMMPEMDGYEVCQRLKEQEDTRSIPVIFVTAMASAEDEYKGLELGAVDYLTKPIIPELTKVRIRNHLELKRHQEQLEELVQEKTNKLQLTQSVMIESLGTLAEYRDPETGGHIKRTQNYVKALAKHLQAIPQYQAELDDEKIELLFMSAPLHDIGKVGVSDAILLKPGKLTDDEFTEMKRHAEYGANALEKAAISLGDESFIECAKEIAYFHHEKWDGSGYPQGIAGTDIPLPGRIMAIADVYDALISKRVYKPPFTHEKAVSIILEEKGKQFEPALVDAFSKIEPTFRNIAILYADFDEEREALGDKSSAPRGGAKGEIRTILVAEDNPINREVMCTQLRHLGFRVKETADGKQALEAFLKDQYDLVLTDLDMPIMSGYELLSEIRQTDEDIPVVAITASDYDLSKEKAFELGFNDYLLKPFDAERMKALVKQLSSTTG